MSNKLYIGNLSYTLDESSLEDEFANVGAVRSVKIVKDFETGRSKGFGFVEMETAELAQNAIEQLDGKEIGGRALKVNIAKEKTDRPQGGGRGDRGFRRR